MEAIMGTLTFVKQFSLGTIAFLGFCAIQINAMSTSTETLVEKSRSQEIEEVQEVEVAQNAANHVQNS